MLGNHSRCCRTTALLALFILSFHWFFEKANRVVSGYDLKGLKGVWSNWSEGLFLLRKVTIKRWLMCCDDSLPSNKQKWYTEREKTFALSRVSNCSDVIHSQTTWVSVPDGLVWVFKISWNFHMQFSSFIRRLVWKTKQKLTGELQFCGRML